MKITIEQKINKPVREVYDAIVDSRHLSQYFVSASSGSLEQGRTVIWSFGPDGETDVRIKNIENNSLIEFEWRATGMLTTVTIHLEVIDPRTTNVKIYESEFRLNKEDFYTAADQSHGWTNMLDCLKAYLEFGVNLKEGRKDI